MNKEIKLIHSDYKKIVNLIPDNSKDFGFADLPYGNGKKGEGTLGSHDIQTVFDSEHVFENYYRILKNDSFFVFCGDFKSTVKWYNECLSVGFKFADDITWVKRKITAMYLPIIRSKEYITIMKKGNPKYYNTKDKYEDIAVPKFIDGLYTYNSLKRVISALKKMSKGGKDIQKALPRKSNDNLHYNSYKSAEYSNYQEKINVTNVWSFMPENHKHNINIKHVSVKPVFLLMRLLKLCLPKPTEHYIPSAIDLMSGSFSLAVACIKLGYNFEGSELYKKYCNIGINRCNKAIKENNENLFSKKYKLLFN